MLMWMKINIKFILKFGGIYMLTVAEIPALKKAAEMQAEMINGGVLYLIIEGDVFTWRLPTKAFDLPLFRVGEHLDPKSVTGRAIREKRRLEENVPRSLYGRRLRTVTEPLFDDNGNAVGAYTIVFPRQHPIVSSFPNFAPTVADMFAEGAVLYLADFQKIISVQQSKKFQIPELTAGRALTANDLTSKALNSKTLQIEEYGSERFGVPVLATATPVFDDEDPSVLVGVMGVLIPKEIATKLRGMSGSLKQGLTEISQTIEQMAAAAAVIHKNEQELNKEIQEILNLSGKINALTGFIKEISDQTNMLGLNAAIEAARVGEAGKGFGVVAQEIRKLSEQIKATVPQIKELTDHIELKVGETNTKSLNSLESSQSQAAATEQVTASVQEISAMSEHLSKIAQQM